MSDKELQAGIITPHLPVQCIRNMRVIERTKERGEIITTYRDDEELRQLENVHHLLSIKPKPSMEDTRECKDLHYLA